MPKKQTIESLRQQLVYAEARAYDNDFIVRMKGRDDAERLRKAIRRLELKERKINLI